MNAAAAVQDLSLHHLNPLVLSDLADLHNQWPLLLLYADPVTWIQAAEPAKPAAGIAALLAIQVERLTAVQPCRLVNLSCISLPNLLAWCLDPASPPPVTNSPSIPGPPPFDALLAIEWLQAHPGHLHAYQALDANPLAAGLDRRPPDIHCLERYRLAANLESLLLARRQQADALKGRYIDLQLSLQAWQEDHEQLSRRVALLEQLVAAGSNASLRLQVLLAQALA
ncbi:MAG: hypothetical protein FJ083_14225 [Cyanobacteria bacterium K_Offshore_surface_m2_239]|nr:hypothetical protein [Cyanobacteria bacterium K_Offshore_surface_m2_239]